MDINNIRTNLTEEQVIINMIELAGYLSEHDNQSCIECQINRINMRFEVREDKE